MKRWIIVGLLLLIFCATSYSSYMLGRYSYLLPTWVSGGPSDREQWYVEKAKALVQDEVPPERLIDPRVVETVRVYFGGRQVVGGVEVTLVKQNGEPLDASY